MNGRYDAPRAARSLGERQAGVMSRRDVLLEALAATPRDLERMLRRVNERAARWRPETGGWRLMDVVAHLGVVESLYLARFQRVVTEDTPYEPAFVVDTSLHDLGQPLMEHVAVFAKRRAWTRDFLGTLSQRDWGRSLVHAVDGTTRLRDQAQALIAHDNEHLSQLVTLREALEAVPQP